VPARTTLPVLANVLLEADPSDGVQLSASNLELTISCRLAAAVSEGGRTTVPARLLADYVALLDRGKQVSLKLLSGGTRLHLACDRYEANVATLPADDFPPTPAATENTPIEVDGAVFKTAIEQVVFAAAPDESRPVLAAVLLRLEAGLLTLVAADGYRLAVRTVAMPHAIGTATWLAPARTLVEVARCLPAAPGLPITLSGSDGDRQLHVALGRTEVTSRLSEGHFPDYQRIMPSGGTTTAIVSTADFLRATRAASLFARDNSNIVRLQCTPPKPGEIALGRVLVRSNSAEMGDNESHLEARVDGQEVHVAFNGRYLRDALEAIGPAQVRLELTHAGAPGLIRPVDAADAGHAHVIMPMSATR